MQANALYYPYIRVPKGPWFTRVLLYWDRVGAIVPREYIDDPDRLGKYMVSLIQEGLVEQVIPGMHLWQVNNFTPSFLEFLDAKYGSKEQRFRSEWAAIHSEKLGGADLHMEKLHGLADELCNRGVAKRDGANEYSPWIKVEPRVAQDFMAYLAGVLGQLSDSERFTPITNGISHFNRFVPKSQRADARVKIRHVLLNNLLPSPSASVSASQLAEFKHRHEELLKRFRRQIEDKVSELAAIPDEEFQRVRLDDIVESFNETVREVTDAMTRQRHWPQFDFATLCSVFCSGLSGLKAVIDHDWAFGVTGAAVGLAPAVVNAFRGADTAFANQPLAYAALAQATLK